MNVTDSLPTEIEEFYAKYKADIFRATQKSRTVIKVVLKHPNCETHIWKFRNKTWKTSHCRESDSVRHKEKHKRRRERKQQERLEKREAKRVKNSHT